jgi:L-ribulokinase
MGAVGVEVKPRVMAFDIGTSTCDIMVSNYEEMSSKLIPGICKQVDGSVIPGTAGLNAVQSALAEVYAWFKNVESLPVVNILSRTPSIDEATEQKPIDETRD